MKQNNALWYLKNNGVENHDARTNATTTYLDMLEANDISHYPAAAAYVKYYILIWFSCDFK